MGKHLSDFAGKHIAFFNRNAAEGEDGHVAAVAARELHKYSEDIQKEAERLTSRDLPQTDSASISTFISLFGTFAGHYMHRDTEALKVVDDTYSEMLKISREAGFKIPYEVHSLVGEVYELRADLLLWDDTRNKAALIEQGIAVYSEAIEAFGSSDAPETGDAQKRLGGAHYNLAAYKDKAQNCKLAIHAYNEALKVFAEELFPEVYPRVKQNLENALDFCGRK